MIAAALIVFVAFVYWDLRRRHKKNLDHIRKTTNRLWPQMRQLGSSLELTATLPFRSFPPTLWGTHSMAPDIVQQLLQVVEEVRPKRILELGSGGSTIFCSYWLERIGKGEILSLDQDEGYAEQSRRQIQAHGLDQTVRLVHAPLVTHRLKGREHLWYDLSEVEGILAGIDLLIIDGPTHDGASRYPALPLLAPYLSPGATLFIDDADPKDPYCVLEQWQREFPQFTFHHLPTYRMSARGKWQPELTSL